MCTVSLWGVPMSRAIVYFLIFAVFGAARVHAESASIESLEVYLRVEHEMQQLAEINLQLTQNIYRAETRNLYQQQLDVVTAAEQDLTSTLKQMKVSNEEILKVQHHFSEQLEALSPIVAVKTEHEETPSEPPAQSAPTIVTPATALSPRALTSSVPAPRAPLHSAASGETPPVTRAPKETKAAVFNNEGRGIGPRLYDPSPEVRETTSAEISAPPLQEKASFAAQKNSKDRSGRQSPVLGSAFPGVGRKAIERLPNSLSLMAARVSPVTVPPYWRWLLILIALSGLSFAMGQWIRPPKTVPWGNGGAWGRRSGPNDFSEGFATSRQFAVRFDPRTGEWLLIKLFGPNELPRVVAQLRPGTVVRGAVLGKPTLVRFRLSEHREWSVTRDEEQLIFSVTPKSAA
jgi:hypothetical protein